jgi:hypothetical protein
MIRRRSTSVIVLQREISSIDRPQPAQRPVLASITQTFMQGVSMETGRVSAENWGQHPRR